MLFCLLYQCIYLNISIHLILGKGSFYYESNKETPMFTGAEEPSLADKPGNSG